MLHDQRHDSWSEHNRVDWLLWYLTSHNSRDSISTSMSRVSPVSPTHWTDSSVSVLQCLTPMLGSVKPKFRIQETIDWKRLDHLPYRTDWSNGFRPERDSTEGIPQLCSTQNQEYDKEGRWEWIYLQSLKTFDPKGPRVDGHRRLPPCRITTTCKGPGHHTSTPTLGGRGSSVESHVGDATNPCRLTNK